MAAARVGANAVLVISGVADIDRYTNALSPLYFLIITGAFVPATVVDGLFMVNASMWDVGNKYIYLGAEAEGFEHVTRPALFIDEQKILKTSKMKALESLGGDVARRLDSLAKK